MSIISLIPLFPLLGFIVNGLGFGKISKNYVALIGILASFFSFLTVCYTYGYFVGNNSQPIILKLFNWININDFKIDFSFQIDQLSLIMLFVITGIGTLIHLYSAGYMANDKGIGKFLHTLTFFFSQ